MMIDDVGMETLNLSCVMMAMSALYNRALHKQVSGSAGGEQDKDLWQEEDDMVPQTPDSCHTTPHRVGRIQSKIQKMVVVYQPARQGNNRAQARRPPP